MTVNVKICGLKTEDALDAALGSGADYVGLVLFSKSPRNLDIETATALAHHTHLTSSARVVALTVDADDETIACIVRRVKPDMLQLHGSETPERVATIRDLSGLPVMKAASVKTAADVAAADVYHQPGVRADIVLYDAKSPDRPGALPGGNGLAFDWHILDGRATRAPFALAGGLTPENVAAAIELTGAAMVDVSSGVERAPGEKDPELIRRFLQVAKAAKRRE
jgi:phosphoribosylanthranilate isomerase